MGTFLAIMMLLLWGVLLVLNLWVFQKSKARGNLLMLVGAGIKVLVFFILLVASAPSLFVAAWLPLIGMVLFVGGFFLSVQPMVQAQLDLLKKKIQDVAAEKKADDAPPSDETKAAADGE